MAPLIQLLEAFFAVTMADGWGGFQRNFAATSSLMTEFWALRDGLTFAKEENVRKLEVETDAQGVIQLLQDHGMANHPLGNIILDCRSLMEEF